MDTQEIDLEEFKLALSNGLVNITIDDKQQPKHQLTPNWRNQVKQAIKTGGNPKGRLFKSVDPQEIVEKYGGTGTMRCYKGNLCVDEFVSLPYDVGVSFSRKAGKYVKTRRVQIKYNQAGVHVFPVLEKE